MTPILLYPPFDLARLTRGFLVSPWKELPAPKKQKGEESSLETWWMLVDAGGCRWMLRVGSMLEILCHLCHEITPQSILQVFSIFASLCLSCVHVIRSNSFQFYFLQPTKSFPASTCVRPVKWRHWALGTSQGAGWESCIIYITANHLFIISYLINSYHILSPSPKIHIFNYTRLCIYIYLYDYICICIIYTSLSLWWWLWNMFE